MSVLDTPELVPVPVNYCPCAGTPHPDGDIVYLYPELSMPAGVRAKAWIVQVMTGELDSVTAQERVAEVWLSMCVADWTFVNDDGSPIPVTPENALRALPYGKGGRLVAEKADDLYALSVTGPLQDQLQMLSQPGSTPSSRMGISQNRASRRKQRSQS